MRFLVLLAIFITTVQAGQISNSLHEKLSKGGSTDVIIELDSLNDVFEDQGILSIKNTEARTNAMFSILKEKTSLSRQPFVKILKELGLDKQRSVLDPIWISNRFEVENVDLSLVKIFANVPGDFLIREPKTANIIDHIQPIPVNIDDIKTKQQYQWGVSMIEAPACWEETKLVFVFILKNIF